MPTSLEAAALFAVLLVPGLQLIAGYNRTRAHTLPRRDLYVLAQAFVASLAWLPVVWLLGGGAVLEWLEEGRLTDHQAALLGVVLLNLAAPLAAGLLAGAAVVRMGMQPGGVAARAVTWTGLLSPPTAWDAIWTLALRRDWAALEIELKDDRVFHVILDRRSVVGLSPGPRYLFFETEYRPDGDDVAVLEHQGIFIDATEVRSVRLAQTEDDRYARRRHRQGRGSA